VRRASIVLALLVVSLAATGAAHAATVSFEQPGPYTWTVPNGVHFATVQLYGAQGGSYVGALGGAGALARATIAVRGLETLTVVVGGRGGQSALTGGAGGAGGGGTGGTGSGELSILCCGPGGAGGGGASDVRTGPPGDAGLASRLVVVGGGGGGGELRGGAGGASGEDAPAGVTEGFICDFVIPPCGSIPGGGGGTPTAGGDGALDGGDGSSGHGGDGGDGPGAIFDLFNLVARVHSGGGGGGGGYFGGGGGASGYNGTGRISAQGSRRSTGGGGGASFVTPDAVCPPAVAGSARQGDGLVTITFEKGGSKKRACAAPAG
jgi:Glycine rich protein